MITLPRLRQVVCLAEHGNYTRAAETLGISQPALTKSVQAMETALGVKLFDRQRGGVTLTEFGTLVVQHARGAVLAEDELVRQINLLAGLETGTLSVALGPYPSILSGYPAIARLLAKHPHLHVSVRVAGWRGIIAAVIEKRADLGLAELTGAERDDTLQTEVVGAHRGRFICRPDHPILRVREIGLAQLLKYPWASVRMPLRIAAMFPRNLGAAGQIDALSGDFVPAVELDVPIQLANLVKQTDVLAISALMTVEDDLKTGAVAVVPTAGLDLQTRYGFIRLKKRLVSPAMSAWMEAIREEERIFVEKEAKLQRLYGSGKRRVPR